MRKKRLFRFVLKDGRVEQRLGSCRSEIQVKDPKYGRKKEETKATSLAFALLECEHAGSEEERSVRDGV